MIHTKRAFTAFLGYGAVLTITGCAMPHINTADLGPGLRTHEEVTRYVSGNFVPNGLGGGNYFAANGSIFYVETKIDQIGTGRWVAGDGKHSPLCMNDLVIYSLTDGTTTETENGDVCFWIYPQADGTDVWDGIGRGNLNVEKTVKGFPLKARFDQLREAMGI